MTKYTIYRIEKYHDVTLRLVTGIAILGWIGSIVLFVALYEFWVKF